MLHDISVRANGPFRSQHSERRSDLKLTVSLLSIIVTAARFAHVYRQALCHSCQKWIPEHLLRSLLMGSLADRIRLRPIQLPDHDRELVSNACKRRQDVRYHRLYEISAKGISGLHWMPFNTVHH